MIEVMPCRWGVERLVSRLADKPIGLLDSGVGGLSVARKLHRRLPGESLVYVADSARHPYGSRPLVEVREYVEEILGFLESDQLNGSVGAKFVVLACHTAAISFLSSDEKQLPERRIPVLGIVDATVRAVLKDTTSGRVGLLATEATVKSNEYERAFRTTAPDIQLFSAPAQELVALVESGRSLTHPGLARKMVAEAVGPLLKRGIDTLVLACSHFPFLLPFFLELVEEEVLLVDPADEVADEVAEAIGCRCGLASPGSNQKRNSGEAPENKGSRVFYVNGDVRRFAQVGSSLLGEELEYVLPYRLKGERKR